MVFLKVIKSVKEQERELRLLILGLDNAGKTTIVNRLCGECVEDVAPTVGFRIKTLYYNEYRLNIWDVGGQKSIRPFWMNYFENTDGIVWVVDSSDGTRLETCKIELKRLLEEERLAGAELFIIANKKDLCGALDVAVIEKILDLKSIKSHHWLIKACSALKNSEGLEEGIHWLVQEIAYRKGCMLKED